jgi:diguanylate cyclase (GGDEF)-like protein
LNNSLNVTVVVVSEKDDHNEFVNTTLRDAGQAARCHRINNVGGLSAALTSKDPDLVVLFDDSPEALERSAAMCSKDGSGAETPLLVVTDEADEDLIAIAMQSGARDLVTMEHIERFREVAARELRTCRIEKNLQQVMNSANQFKSELHSLKQVSVEAIADVQEGIVVNTNPAWLELFGFPENTDLMGHPIMDLCSKADQPALKGGIVACQRGKWQDDTLKVTSVTSAGQEFRVAFCLESIECDGEPAVRMLIKPESEEQKAPVVVVERSLQQDPLTGFYHRQHFSETAAERISQNPAGGVRAIAYIRIDRFSRVTNDIGIIGTDSIIAQFAQTLREHTQPTDVYGRFGGTMFAVMLERGNMDDAEAWANTLLHQVAESAFEYDQRSTILSCSVGLCELDDPETPLEHVVNDAERACCEARQNGGNQLGFSESSGAAKQLRQDDDIWIPRLRGALMDNRFRLEHQPVASLNSDVNEAWDILVRMLDEDGNTILPSEFMPVAERTGLSKNIDRWVIGASFSFCLTNSAELLFIRLSRSSVLDNTLTDWLKSQLDRTLISATRVCFEVDEQIALDHLVQTQRLSEKLRELGFKFAIEHFGKSPDCSQLLDRIELELVKIDGSLMQGLNKDPEAQGVVQRLARLAAEKDVETVAERVQDANTMAVLWQLGVSYIQGNYVQTRDIVLEDTSQSTVTTRALQLQV